GSSAAGLSAAEAAKRLMSYGPNTPVREVRTRPLLAFAANFIHTLALLLWFAAGLAFAAGAPELGGAIVAVVVVNGVFAFLQEYRAEQVVQSLMKSVAVQARLVRDGVEVRLPAESLVPGDVIRVAAGDITPADAVLLSDDNLTLDLSMITGESKPVERSAAAAAAADGGTLVDLAPALPGGAAVVTGTAEAVVCATGSASTMGRVASLVEGVNRGGSILEKQVGDLSLVTAIIAVIAGTGTLLLTAAFTETPFIAALTFATGVIVALVPEGLLPTLSVSLAIGARRMAARGAAVRRLSAVEVIGSVTVICTDKTGTLTQNAISVLGIVTEGEPDAGTRAIEGAVLCNDARAVDDGFAGDAVDVALLKFAVSEGSDVTAIRSANTRVADVPFDAQHRYMSVTCERAGVRVDYIKGAPEEVLALTKAKATPALEKAIQEVAERGERVLLLAIVEPGAPPKILGLVRMFDPPRPEVPAAVAAARSAGIRIVMLTGDHPVTATTVATTIGFSADDMTVVEGQKLDGLTDSALLAILKRDAIFARIDPSQKLRIVSLLRRSGEVVVVTGDGINDAPALRAADVGVAMGLRGSEVAKQAADMVLADDNFATIVAAIEEGRAIKANIRRFVSYVFTSNVAELLPFLLFIFLPIPLPLAVIQVLAIDLGTDLLPALALGTEGASERIMASRPEPPHRALLTRPLFLKTFLFYGVVEALLGMGAFFAYYLSAGWRPFDAMDESILREASTLTFLGIVAGQIGCLFASRDGGLWQRLSPRSNGWVAVGLACELALTLAFVYLPGLNRVFSMGGISPVWLTVLPCGAAIFLGLDEARRAIAGRLAH
ncbi:MAG TPA: cation-transporting P-type ATPase, partial [Tepidiformaceae bacterium]